MYVLITINQAIWMFNLQRTSRFAHNPYNHSQRFRRNEKEILYQQEKDYWIYRKKFYCLEDCNTKTWVLGIAANDWWTTTFTKVFVINRCRLSWTSTTQTWRRPARSASQSRGPRPPRMMPPPLPSPTPMTKTKTKRWTYLLFMENIYGKYLSPYFTICD